MDHDEKFAALEPKKRYRVRRTFNNGQSWHFLKPPSGGNAHARFATYREANTALEAWRDRSAKPACYNITDF